MPEHYYAQIDQNGKVVGISQLAEEMKMDNLIPISKEQYNNRNMLYTNYSGGSFTGTSANIEADKQIIAPNGIDVMTVKLQVSDWKDAPQEDFAEDVIIEVNGVQQTVKVTNGVAEISLSSNEPGEFIMRTVNLDRNAELRVVVTDEF